MTAGLEHPVRVVVTGWVSRTCTHAATHDAFFVNGYLQALDRFFEVDPAPFFSRRAADGTRSEVSRRLRRARRASPSRGSTR
jgi:acyl-homoserine lactone acylase PvdQ